MHGVPPTRQGPGPGGGGGVRKGTRTAYVRGGDEDVRRFINFYKRRNSALRVLTCTCQLFT